MSGHQQHTDPNPVTGLCELCASVTLAEITVMLRREADGTANGLDNPLTRLAWAQTYCDARREACRHPAPDRGLGTLPWDPQQ